MKMKIDVNKVTSHWECADCGTGASFTFADCAEAGTPVCGDCDDDMELCDEVTITEPESEACQNCGSDDFEYEDQEVSNGETREIYTCNGCGERKTEIYTFTNTVWG